MLRAHSLCVHGQERMQPTKPQETLTIAQSSVVFCSEMAALAWMEEYSTVCCQKLLYHSRAFCHRLRFKLSNCVGVCIAPNRLHYPHLITSAKSLRPAFPSDTWREQWWRDNGRADCVLTGPEPVV